MNKEKLVLVQSMEMYFFPWIRSSQADVCAVFQGNKLGMPGRIMRRLHLPIDMFLGKWKHELYHYKKIILFDAVFQDSIMKYLLKHISTDTEIFLYLWNPIYNNQNKLKCIERYHKFITVYSFDKEECEKYGFRYNSMVYSKDVRLPKSEIKYDVFFLGFAKDRMEEIVKFYHIFKEEGLKVKFYVFDEKSKESKQEDFIISSKKVPYEQYLKILSESRAILDIVQRGQSGLSIRFVEASFFKKKLITTNWNVKNYELYNEKNIAIINEKGQNYIGEFIRKEWDSQKDGEIETYEFDRWIERFKK